LLLLNVPERAVMDVMGWSSSAMVKRYQHISAPVRVDIAKRVGGLLWQEPKRGQEGQGQVEGQGREKIEAVG
jgi:hypothetical protein